MECILTECIRTHVFCITYVVSIYRIELLCEPGAVLFVACCMCQFNCITF